MKLQSGRKRAGRYELDMASMIDVVFLLLIFFMCTSSFSKPEKELDISSTVPGESSKVTEFEPIRIALTNSAAGVAILCDSTPCSDIPALIRELTRRRQLADASVIVEGSGRVPFEVMIHAVETAKHAKFTNVAFSVGAGR